MNAIVFPRDRDLPPPGETLEIAPGIHWLRMPLPFQLDHINLWLLEDGAGWTIVDTGLKRAETMALWERVFARHAIGPGGGRPVARQIVTHFHPDHMGLAGWLGHVLGAELWTPRTEFLFARAIWLDETGEGQRRHAEHYRHHGMDAGRAEAIGRRGNTYRLGVHEPPARFRRLKAGDRVAIGGRTWEVMIGLGHAPEHACLYCAEAGVLIAGDQILPKITPNIGVWFTEPEADPLADYLASLGQFRRLPAETLVLPSHNLPFTGLHRRLDELAAHHEVRFDRLAAALDGAGKPAMALLPALFPRALDDFQIGLALGETIAHLHCMVGQGRAVRRDAGGPVLFSAA
jgi:glyoxylase-like metal-dependent hydrolase (beta-lactamase superfamily II)